jgi:hypothetical protein
VFSAATMNFFVTRSRLWESAVLLVCCFAMFRPGWFLDQFSDPYLHLPGRDLATYVQNAAADQRLMMVVEGTNLEGEDVRKTVSIPLGDKKDAAARLRAAGFTVAPDGDRMRITTVAFGSYAKRIGLDVGYQVTQILQPAERTSRVVPAALGLLVVAGIAALQYARVRRKGAAAATVRGTG